MAIEKRSYKPNSSAEKMQRVAHRAVGLQIHRVVAVGKFY